MATGTPEPVSELEAQREEIVDALAKAHPYNADWWIGRVVGHETGMTFVPSEAKLMSVRSDAGDECVKVYQQAPVMRPLVLLGPTSKESELTRLLHKPLLSYIREKFSGRLLTIKPDQSVRSMTAKEIRLLDGDVFAAASTMNLVLLDSDASYPGDFEGTKLHPQFIYVKISRQKVLHNLIRQLTKSSRDQQIQVEDARYLYDNSSNCSLVITDSNVDDACLNLELFLESYWASTRSVMLLGGGVS
ncbi:voltage-dependent L-type calcium channel subunit beta-3-like isoform X2 [Halichondria panicea]|uniref:voltage-dependent L-type calcium channel subunit beta-3-like isoform X2 n=1 Tax=Halichondria panicea TaxID=6063 RepID=UPI00312BC50C